MSNSLNKSVKVRRWGIVFLVLAVIAISVWNARRIQAEAFAKRTHCVGNLIILRSAKAIYQADSGLVDGEPILEDALRKYLPKPVAQFKCPSGGNYVLGNTGELPRCTYSNLCFTYRFDLARFRIERRAWAHSLD